MKCALAGVSPNPPRTELGPAMLEEFKKLAFQQCMAKCLKTVNGLSFVQLDFKGEILFDISFYDLLYFSEGPAEQEVRGHKKSKLQKSFIVNCL